MENYDVLGATRPIETFVDRLSNWYLRRSRRRFWRAGESGDKQAAYATLYECLVTLARLIAPAMPFLADALYRTLVVSQDKEAAESVHLADWPEYDRAMIDEGLNAEMRRVLQWASLGHAARNKANRKVRQPLAEVAFSLSSPKEAELLARYADLLGDELNVKKVRPLDAAGEVVSYTLNPLPKALGPKFGARFPKVRSALLGLEPEQAARQLLAGSPLRVKVDGEEFEVLPEEVEVRVSAREGFAVAEEGGALAALRTDITPGLLREGLAREFVRRVQDLRKTSGLEIADRIRLFYTASTTLAEAVEQYRDYVMGETLATELRAGAGPEGAFAADDEFDGEKVTLALLKAR
jgi:isoleucyl-tRNA synthetase